MSNVSSVILSNDELIKLFRFIPKGDLIKYLRMKEYRDKYAKAFSTRIDKVNDLLIANFYHNEVFRKRNEQICEHYNKLFSKIKEKFEDELKQIYGDNIETIASSDVYRFEEIIKELEKKQYDLELLPTLFKLNNINLSDTFLYIISSICKHRKEIDSLITQQNETDKNEIIRSIEKSYESKINKQEKNHKQELMTLELKYREEDEQTRRIIDELKNENGQNIINHDKQVSSLNARITSLENSVNEQLKLLKEVEKTLVLKSELLNQKEKFIAELYKKCGAYERLLDLKVIDKEMLVNMIDEIELNNKSLKNNFKKFIDELPENEEDRNVDLLTEWQKWINEETNCINKILTKSVSKGEIERQDLEILDETSYILQFRYLLIRLIMALEYKYLSSECWKEVFK